MGKDSRRIWMLLERIPFNYIPLRIPTQKPGSAFRVMSFVG
jgi:hypothetical protein